MLGYPKKSVVASIIFFVLAIGIIIFILRVPLKVGEYVGFSLKIISPTAEGLGVGSPVLISGVQVGKIKKIELSEDGKRAIITVDIKGGTKIARDSKVEFRMKGILGDRVIVFIQGEKLDEPLEDEDIIFVGEERTEISQITTSIEATAQKLSETLDSVKALSEKVVELVDNLNELVIDIRSKEIDEDLKGSSEKLEETISEAYKAVKNVNQLISDIRSIVGKIDPKVSDFSEDITQISENIRSISDDIRKMVQRAQSNGMLELAIGDDSKKIEKIIDDLDNLSPKIVGIAEKAQSIAERAENLTSKIDAEIGGKVEGGINESKPVFSQQIQTRIKNERAFFEFGIISPPGEDRLSINTMVGASISKYLEIGIGFMRSKPSLLAEVKPVNYLFLRTEGIGFTSPNIRTLVGGRYKIIGVYGGAENVLNKNRFFLLGVEVRN
ncbi:MAG: MlaD family protein [Candidatus Calescibacterium sp.]|nr:MlaD family protein [Candidatus Calescibacterium sp.]MCX7734586.1 MlaD family protein [bacterium]MDW8086512.1 MlaD family protein [Candidatus Calescibacterium sp.]